MDPTLKLVTEMMQACADYLYKRGQEADGEAEQYWLNRAGYNAEMAVDAAKFAYTSEPIP